LLLLFYFCHQEDFCYYYFYYEEIFCFVNVLLFTYPTLRALLSVGGNFFVFLSILNEQVHI
jgi:hypothetical protein